MTTENFDVNGMSDERRAIRGITRGAYQLQKLRVAIGLRIVAQWKVKMGQAPSRPERELDAKGQKLLSQIRKDYKTATDGFVFNLKGKKSFEKHGLIDEFSEVTLIRQYERQLEIEKEAFTNLQFSLDGIRLWDEFLSDILGLGPAMAGVIISEINIHKADHVSSLWKYCGVDVVKFGRDGEEDGRGRGTYKAHQVDKVYVDADGKETDTVGLSFNPFVKSKVTFVLGGCLLKAKSPKYYKIYCDYKHRLENRTEDIKPVIMARNAYVEEIMTAGKPDGKESNAAKERRQKSADKKGNAKYPKYTKNHLHNMANRYMIKMFLADLYVAWRTMEGLNVRAPYAEEKLGLKHSKAA